MDETPVQDRVADVAARLPVGFEGRAYQQRIIAKVLGHFGEGIGSVLVESPTGSGKTVMGLAVAAAVQAATPGLRVGWCAMRRNLLRQVERENNRGFGVDLTTISMFDKQPPPADLLVIDEAQHDGALSMANLHSHIKPKLILGLSATPFRSDRVKLCFEKVIKDAGIHRLIQDGYLAPYHHYTLDHWSPRRVATAYADEATKWGKSLMFFHTLEQCATAQTVLAGRGVRSEVVTAKTDRERQLADFEHGRLDVLINMLLLAEGFDCPTLQTVFCRPSGKLPTIQMAGRALRKHDSLTHKHVVQCPDTRHPFPRTAQPAEQFLWQSNSWRSVKTTGELDAFCQKMQTLLAGIEPEMPQYITDRPDPALQRTRRRDAAYG
jgi:superfamily II DNA or RNA helicase